MMQKYWHWILIAVIAAGGYIYWKKQKSAPVGQ